VLFRAITIRKPGRVLVPEPESGFWPLALCRRVDRLSGGPSVPTFTRPESSPRDEENVNVSEPRPSGFNRIVSMLHTPLPRGRFQPGDTNRRKNAPRGIPFPSSQRFADGHAMRSLASSRTEAPRGRRSCVSRQKTSPPEASETKSPECSGLQRNVKAALPIARAAAVEVRPSSEPWPSPNKRPVS
jgi:hypothetical protein